MLTNFKELEDYVLSRNMKKRIAMPMTSRRCPP